MKYLQFVVIAVSIVPFFFCYCNQPVAQPEELIVANQSTTERFYYNADSSLPLMVNVLVDGKYSALMLLDNGTDDKKIVAYSREFARKNLLKDTSFLSEIQFQKDSLISFTFGSLSCTNVKSYISPLPRSKKFHYDGIIGLGFLKNYLLEINYEEKYFSLHKAYEVDTFLFLRKTMRKKHTCPEIEIEFYTGKKLIKLNANLDLGFIKNSFLIGKASAQEVMPLDYDFKNSVKDSAKMSGGILSETIHFNFDSIRLYDQPLKYNGAELCITSSGLFAGKQVWFGNGVLKSFGRIYLDFNKNALYVPRNGN